MPQEESGMRRLVFKESRDFGYGRRWERRWSVAVAPPDLAGQPKSVRQLAELKLRDLAQSHTNSTRQRATRRKTYTPVSRMDGLRIVSLAGAF